MNFPTDGGPIYSETDLSRFPVEPWNACSLIVFLVIVIYWAWRVRKSRAPQRLIRYSLPLLFVGFIGGAAYHATRSNQIWLIMDYLPILLLAFSAAAHFWIQLRNSSRSAYNKALFSIVILITSSFLLQSFPKQVWICATYLNLSALTLLPAFILAGSQGRRGIRLLLLASFVFLSAVVFRMIDFIPAFKPLFPMGTHFLWHILGGLAAHYLIIFIYELEEEKYSTLSNRALD